MTSPYAAKIAQIRRDISQVLVSELQLMTPFQPDPTQPGQRFGVLDYQGWESSRNEYLEQEGIRASIWLTAGYASFEDCTDGLIGLTADLRSLIPSLHSQIDGQGILLKLGYPTNIPATKRAPIAQPNTLTKHLWIGDIVVPISLEVAISKSACGEHST